MAYSVEAAFIAFVAALGEDAHFAVPKDRPQRLVTVSRSGGEIQNRVDYPEVAIDVWSSSAKDASDRALAIRSALLSRRPPEGVRKITAVLGPNWYPDPDTRQPCYELVVTCSCRVE